MDWTGLEAGVMEEGIETRNLAGTPQGGVISPLLSNIYLHYLDTVWRRQCAHLGKLVRYCDDLVVMCSTRQQAEAALERLTAVLAGLGLAVAASLGALLVMEAEHILGYRVMPIGEAVES